MFYKLQTKKNIKEVIKAFWQKAGEYGYVVRNVYNMNDLFASHGALVNKQDEYYAVMLCNPKRAHSSIAANPDRGAVLLQPKQVFVYKQDKENRTTVAYAAMDEEYVKRLLPDDAVLQKNLPRSCAQIADLIKAVV
jgi:uncharacterized protein (DUF302 family)